MDWIAPSLRGVVFALTLVAALFSALRPAVAEDQAPEPAPQKSLQSLDPQQTPPSTLTQPYAHQPAQGRPTAVPSAPTRAPRPSRAMMIAGISTLGGAYLGTAAMGSWLLAAEERSFETNDSSDTCYKCHKTGRRLLVPLFGPFLALGMVDNTNTIFALLGAVQLLGAGLTIGGIVRFKNGKRRYEETGGYAFDLRHGRALSPDVSTSPYMVGPRMELRF